MLRPLTHLLSGLIVCVTLMVAAVFAQSPNNASMIVTVVDQDDAVVRSVNISVVTPQQGTAAEVLTAELIQEVFRVRPTFIRTEHSMHMIFN